MVTLEGDKPQISENGRFSPNHKLNIDSLRFLRLGHFQTALEHYLTKVKSYL